MRFEIHDSNTREINLHCSVMIVSLQIENWTIAIGMDSELMCILLLK